MSQAWSLGAAAGAAPSCKVAREAVAVSFRALLLGMHSATHTPGLIEPVPSLPDDLLLERDPELSILGQRLAALGTGGSSGGSVLLSGEAGVGKTSVLRAAARRADPDIEWLWGTCEPMLSPTPLGPLVDWLDRMPPALAAAVRSGRHAADVLSGVLAMLRDPSQPTVLVIDDAQWADSATLDLLRYLGRRIESTSALLVPQLSRRRAQHRSSAAGRAARACLRAAASAWRSRPCRAHGVAQMARRAGRSARGLYQVTQGNPFFVSELLAGDPQALPAIGARGGPGARRTAAASARDVLELASVSPTPIEVAVVAAIVDDDARRPSPHARTPGCWRWKAPRSAFATSWHAAPSRRRSRPVAPRRSTPPIFDALSARNAALVRLVHHAARAGLLGLRAVARATSRTRGRAGERASPGRRRSMPWRSSTRRTLPPAEQAALHVAHSLECQHIQRHDDATVSRRAALALHRKLGDRLSEGRDLYELAVIEQYREGPQAGLPYVHAAIEVLEGIDAPVDLAVAYAAKAQMHLNDATSQPPPMGHKALALARRAGGRRGMPGLCPHHRRLGAIALPGRARSLGAPRAQPRHRAASTVSSRMRRTPSCRRPASSLIHRRYADAEDACERGLAYSESPRPRRLPGSVPRPPRLRAARDRAVGCGRRPDRRGAADQRTLSRLDASQSTLLAAADRSAPRARSVAARTGTRLIDGQQAIARRPLVRAPSGRLLRGGLAARRQCAGAAHRQPTRSSSP